MYDRSLLTFMSRWLDVRTHTDHTVFGVANDYTGGQVGIEVVVYYSQDGRHLAVRDIDEFLDGRFLPLDYNSSKEV